MRNIMTWVPESQSLSQQVQETAQQAREPSASCKEESLEPGGQQDRRSPPFSRAEPLAANAKGYQCGIHQHSGVWSPGVSTVVWNLPKLYLESGVLHPSRSLNKGLGTPNGKWGLSPEAYLWVVLLCRHGCSGHVCRCLKCVSLPDVSAVTK